MSELLVVFGATGQQGGSVASYVLADPALSKQYTLRGVCRDVSKPAAKTLQERGVEVVAADLDDAEALAAAVRGAHTVFGMTRTVYDADAKAREVRQGRALADAAVAAGVQRLIFSTGAHAEQISGGKYPVAAYDSKAEVEAYIRGLAIRSAFVGPATFMQNFGGMMAPRKQEDGSYVIANIHAGDAPFPWIDVVQDTGKFVGAILAEPEKFDGKTLHAGAAVASLDEVAALMSRVYGVKVVYQKMPEENYRTFLPPAAQDAIVNMFYYIQDCGYYGPDTAKTVEWAAQQARGKLTSLEDYFQQNAVIKSE